MSVAGAVVPGTPRTVHGSHGNSRTERRRGARPADENKCIYYEILIIRSTPLTKLARGIHRAHVREEKPQLCTPGGSLRASSTGHCVMIVLSGVRRAHTRSRYSTRLEIRLHIHSFAPLFGSVALLIGLKACAQFRRAAHILGAHLGCSWVRGGGAGARSAGSQRVACCDDEV